MKQIQPCWLFHLYRVFSELEKHDEYCNSLVNRPLDVKKNEREMTASKRVSISCQESTHKKRSSILSVLGSPLPLFLSAGNCED